MSTTTAVNSTSTSSAVFEAINNSKAKDSESKIGDAQDRFLKLLVTQLKNQDPLNPLDNAQVTSQMAQISTVSGIEKLNTTLQALMDSATQSQNLQAASLVGHGVLVPGTGLALGNGAAVGGVDLAGAADSVTVTIKDSNGIIMRSLKLGALEEGSHVFSWDGKTENGVAAAEGNYTVSISAKQGQNDVSVNALQVGLVTSISQSSKGVSLNVGNLGSYKVSDVKEIL